VNLGVIRHSCAQMLERFLPLAYLSQRCRQVAVRNRRRPPLQRRPPERLRRRILAVSPNGQHAQSDGKRRHQRHSSDRSGSPCGASGRNEQYDEGGQRQVHATLSTDLRRDRHDGGRRREDHEEREREKPYGGAHAPRPERECYQSHDQEGQRQNISQNDRARLAIGKHQPVRPQRVAQVLCEDLGLIEQVRPRAHAEREAD
jgi:hypothetical protein